jgi:hypothetical protein
VSAPGWGQEDRSYGVLPPVRITRTEWWEALEVMWPSKWRRAAGCESFHICEYVSGNIVQWFVRIGSEDTEESSRYFKLQDVDSRTPAWLHAECRPLLGAHLSMNIAPPASWEQM